MTIGCARCHDHKFDPISAEDYYALAGIFFSTSLVPGPVPGNTPLVRVPLLPPDELARLRAQDAADRRRRAELEQQLPDADDRAWIAHLGRLITGQTARYLVAACEYRNHGAGSAKLPLDELARQRGLHPALLAGWVDFLEQGRDRSRRRAVTRPCATRRPGSWSGPALTRGAAELQQALAALAARREAAPPGRPRTDLAGACVLRFRADDPYLRHRSGFPGHALAESFRAAGRRPAADRRRSAPSRRPPRSTAGPGPCCGSTAVPCSKRRAPCRRPAACSSSSGPRTASDPAIA